MRFEIALTERRLTLAALCSGGLLLSVGCRSDELQEPGQATDITRPPAMAVAPTSGLVGEWKLDETSGTVAHDTKSGFDGTVAGGAAFVAAKIGNGINLDNGAAGTGGKYVEMPSNATLDNVQEGDYTISAWVNPTTVPPDQGTANHHWAIVVKAGWHMGLVYQHDQRFSMRHYLTGDTLKTANSSATYAPKAWHHLAGVVSKTAGTVTLYVDGASAGSTPFTAGRGAREFGTTRFRIGKAASNWALDGKVDQVRIYNRALSAAEVGDLFQETSGALGIPFGPGNLFRSISNIETVGTESFSLGMDGVTHNYIIDRINAVRELNASRPVKVKLLTSMTGGPHTASDSGRFLRTINGELQFSMAEWKKAMRLYNTPEIKNAVADAVRDGIIIGNNVMDEPFVSGEGDGNTWGPPGTMTKARVDSMCKFVKDSVFPTLPTGVAHSHHLFEPEKSYQSCDFIIDQYSARFGAAGNGSISDVTAYRDEGLRIATAGNHAIIFAYNVINGGVQDKDGTWDCSGAGQGNLGQREPNCSMTPAQIRDWGQVLGPAGCAMTLWRYDDAFMANSSNQQAFADVAALLSTKPSKACRRS
jgi:hypothetical protein